MKTFEATKLSAPAPRRTTMPSRPASDQRVEVRQILHADRNTVRRKTAEPARSQTSLVKIPDGGVSLKVAPKPNADNFPGDKAQNNDVVIVKNTGGAATYRNVRNGTWSWIEVPGRSARDSAYPVLHGFIPNRNITGANPIQRRKPRRSASKEGPGKPPAAKVGGDSKKALAAKELLAMKPFDFANRYGLSLTQVHALEQNLLREGYLREHQLRATPIEKPQNSTTASAPSSYIGPPIYRVTIKGKTRSLTKVEYALVADQLPEDAQVMIMEATVEDRQDDIRTRIIAHHLDKRRIERVLAEYGVRPLRRENPNPVVFQPSGQLYRGTVLVLGKRRRAGRGNIIGLEESAKRVSEALGHEVLIDREWEARGLFSSRVTGNPTDNWGRALRTVLERSRSFAGQYGGDVYIELDGVNLGDVIRADLEKYQFAEWEIRTMFSNPSWRRRVRVIYKGRPVPRRPPPALRARRRRRAR